MSSSCIFTNNKHVRRFLDGTGTTDDMRAAYSIRDAHLLSDDVSAVDRFEAHARKLGWLAETPEEHERRCSREFIRLAGQEATDSVVTIAELHRNVRRHCKPREADPRLAELRRQVVSGTEDRQLYDLFTEDELGYLGW